MSRYRRTKEDRAAIAVVVITTLSWVAFLIWLGRKVFS
jgi:hypothetical protein